MNKLTKVLSVFALAGAIGAGVAGAAGCAHKHTYEDKWTSGGAEGHYHVATCHPDEHDAIKPHTFDNDQDTTCNDCGYTRTVDTGTPTTPGEDGPGTPSTPGNEDDEKVKAPAGLSALIVEEVGDASVQLSAEKKSHTIDKSAIKVYYGTGDRSNPTKGDEVPAANIDLRLLDPSNQACDSWEGLKLNGTYTIIAKLKDVVSSTGSALNADQYPGTAKVTVINKATAIAVKSGATLSQDQSVVDSMTPTWSYEITRQNEEKEDIAASEVTVGRVDHVRAGADKTATLTTEVEGVTVKGTVTYTVNAVTGAVVQTTIVHANSENTGDISTKHEIGEDTGIYAVGSSSNKIAVDGNVVSVDGKAFSQRLKLGGSALNSTSDRGKAVGDEIAGLKDGRYFEFENLNATTTEGATSKTLITIYGTTGSAGATRKLTLYKVDEEGKMTVAATNTLNDQVKKYTYVVDDAATYRLASEDSGCNVYYFQIDKILIGEENAQDVTPAGDPTPVGIEVDASAAKLVYKKDETVSTEGVVVTFVKSNAATCDRTEEIVTTGITYSEVSTGSLGEKDVTVTYTDGTNNYTAKYTITVESAVAGVWGAKGSLSANLVTALPEGSAADATITVALDDLEAEIVGNSTTATATVTAATYKAEDAEEDGTEITAAGVDIGKGKYVITATVKVTDGDDEATFEVEIPLSVTIVGELETVTISFPSTGATMDIEESTVVSVSVDTTNGQLRTGQGTYTFVEGGTTYDGATYNTKGSGLSSNKLTKRAVTITLAKAGTYKVSVYAKLDAANSNRAAVISTSSDVEVTSATRKIGNTDDKYAIFEFDNFVVGNDGQLLVGADNNIDIYAIVIEPVA